MKKRNILYFVFSAAVSLLLVLAAPAGADFFTQVVGQSTGLFCPLPQIVCGNLNNQCATAQECDAANAASGLDQNVGQNQFNTNSFSCPSGKFKCASLNNQCATAGECYAADSGCPSGQMMCNVLNKCTTNTECQAADQSKTSTTTTTTTQPTTNQTTTTPKFTTGTQTTTDKTTTTPKFTTPFQNTDTTEDTSTPKFTNPFQNINSDEDTSTPKFTTPFTNTAIDQSTAKMKQPSTTNQTTNANQSTTKTKQPAGTDKLTKGDQAKTTLPGKSQKPGQPAGKSVGSQQQPGKAAPGKVGNKDSDNEIFNVSTFGDKDINIPKLPSSINLEATDHTKNLKALSSLVKKTTKLKSNEEAMGKILLISQSLSDICEDANLKCSGREKLSDLIDDASSEGITKTNMKKIKKALESLNKSVKKEYTKIQKSFAKSAKTKKSSTKK